MAVFRVVAWLNKYVVSFCKKGCRTMHHSDLLISIHPRHVEKILAGEKLVELRKRTFPSDPARRVWLYSTSPDRSVRGVVFVTEVAKASPATIWRKYGKKVGVAREEFDAYYAGSETAYALSLHNPRRLKADIGLEALKASSRFFIPQYYRHIEHESPAFTLFVPAIESLEENERTSESDTGHLFRASRAVA